MKDLAYTFLSSVVHGILSLDDDFWDEVGFVELKAYLMNKLQLEPWSSSIGESSYPLAKIWAELQAVHRRNDAPSASADVRSYDLQRIYVSLVDVNNQNGKFG